MQSYDGGKRTSQIFAQLPPVVNATARQYNQ